ncbi:hypothetical protein DFJ73DRAFT_837462 [Zopfochytrium polystomum]|nr:hypothetical protein DFJ73DRAFT_837462 [Zopfochytrium polystomum]
MSLRPSYVSFTTFFSTSIGSYGALIAMRPLTGNATTALHPLTSAATTHDLPPPPSLPGSPTMPPPPSPTASPAPPAPPSTPDSLHSPTPRIGASATASPQPQPPPKSKLLCRTDCRPMRQRIDIRYCRESCFDFEVLNPEEVCYTSGLTLDMKSGMNAQLREAREGEALGQN